jgi:hypothetical protein
MSDTNTTPVSHIDTIVDINKAEKTLRSLLELLQGIDANASTRGTFASSIMMNQFHGLDKSIFADEICEIKTALGIPCDAPIPLSVQESEATSQVCHDRMMEDL